VRPNPVYEEAAERSTREGKLTPRRQDAKKKEKEIAKAEGRDARRMGGKAVEDEEEEDGMGSRGFKPLRLCVFA